jgi:alpha-L-arabinofuranosidase
MTSHKPPLPHMKRLLFSACWLACALHLSAAGTSDPRAAIKVDLSAEKAPVSPMLHGIFLEEINHAFDGGLYAELVQNRSFEEGVLPPGVKLVPQADGRQKMELTELPAGVPQERWPMPWPWGENCYWDQKRELIGWSLENRGMASGSMALTTANPMNAASSRSLELQVNAEAAPDKVALINSGYWGIPITTGTRYDLKFHLLPTEFSGTVTARLESADGKLLASQDFPQIQPGKTWTRLTAQLTAQGTDPKARLVLAFHGKGKLQVDWVSLFPPTYKGRPNGLRADLAQYLEGLKPGFIRYPGGCYIQGISWDSAPDWRKMVCPPEERPGQWGYWKYRSSDGFGYHEFLQLCEDLGAEPLYVAFAGMTVHPDNNMPLDQIDPIIQRALDAIEYARGPVTSHWGAVRAKMGHPQPFSMKYVEIGNEHPPAIYGDYYVKFRDAIKAKYPDITVIMSMYWSGLNQPAIDRAGDSRIDMVDEHAYRDASWVRSNFHYYDHYARKPWSIYIGEYSSQHGGGDWYGAMGDSLYLMMCERNGDLIKMASYAPLFCNVNQRDWPINLIEYDSSRSYAHASYYVQQMFAENRPDTNLATESQLTTQTPKDDALLAGRIGLGAWNTQTEFKEFRVYDESGRQLMREDFHDLRQWDAPLSGDWSVKDGVLKQSSTSATPAMILLKSSSPFKTGKITFKARRTGGSEGFLAFFNATGLDDFMFANFGAAGNAFSAIQNYGNSTSRLWKDGKNTPGAIDDAWHEVTLILGKNTAEALLDGKSIASGSMEAMPTFFTNAGYEVKSKSIILKATNYLDHPLQTEISIQGAQAIAAKGVHQFISSDQIYGENSLEKPTQITRQTLPLDHCAPRFTVTLPAHSVNVLRIPALKK